MKSSDKGGRVPAGKIAGLHGVKGEVKVVPYGDLDERHWKAAFVETTEARDEAGGASRPVKRGIKRARGHKGGFIVEIEGFETRDSSAMLVGKEVLMEKADLPAPEKDEYYCFDLLGMEVVTEDGKLLGNVTGMLDTGSNDVIEVTGPDGEILVPAIEDVIQGVDTGGKRITVRLLDGLIPEPKAVKAAGGRWRGRKTGHGKTRQ